MASKEGLFRKSSLERLSSPEKLDQIVRVTTPKAWMSLLAISFIILTGIVWSIYGVVSTKVVGAGMLIRSEGILKIEHNVSGKITDIRIRPGDSVKKGDTIARMASPDLIEKISQLNFEMDNMLAREKRIVQYYGESEDIKGEYLKKERANVEKRIADLNINLAELEEKARVQESIYRQGGISKSELLATEDAIRELKLQKEKISNELRSIKLDELSSTKNLNGELSELRNSIERKKMEIAYLKELLVIQSRVISPYTGRILEVLVHKDGILREGEAVATIELTGRRLKNLEAVIFVSPMKGKDIKPGMDASIDPSNVKSEEYGVMMGKVTYVSDYPVTFKYIAQIFGEDIAKSFAMNEAPVEVRIDLIPDSKTVSGYRWTSRNGPPIKIQTGTMCGANISVKKERPIWLLLPILKRSVGIN